MAKGISVIIETFNFAADEADLETLRRNIESLRQQTYSGDMEIIVVVNENNSFLLSKISGINGITAVKTPATGYVAMKNAGLVHAKFDFAAFCDSDVEVSKNWLEEAFSALQENEAVTGTTKYNPGVFSKALTIMMFGFVQGAARKEVGLVVGNNMAFRKSLLDKYALIEKPARGGLTIFSNKIISVGKKIVFNPKMRARHKYSPGLFWQKMLTDSHDYVKTIQAAPWLKPVPLASFWVVSVFLITAKQFGKDLKNFLLHHSNVGVGFYEFPAYALLFAIARALFFLGLIIAIVSPGWTERKYGVY